MSALPPDSFPIRRDWGGGGAFTSPMRQSEQWKLCMLVGGGGEAVL